MPDTTHMCQENQAGIFSPTGKAECCHGFIIVDRSWTYGGYLMKQEENKEV